MSLGFAQDQNFDNPLAEQRADPWVYKTNEGVYYLIATVPEYNRIVMRKADSINGLKEAEEKTLWKKQLPRKPLLTTWNGKWKVRRR